MPGLSDLVRHVTGRARSFGRARRIRSSLAVRARVARLVYTASPGLAVSVLVFVLVEGFLPTLALVAIGSATGRIPAAVAEGLGSPAGTPCWCPSPWGQVLTRCHCYAARPRTCFLPTARP